MKDKIPLINRIRRESHRQIALLQDIVIYEVYKILPRAVLHGGTSIWRCYSGKRFSEDLDFYFPNDKKGIYALFQNLKNLGFEIIKKKVSDRSVYSEFIFNRTSVRLEATFQKCNGLLVDYEKIDGTIIYIFSLSSEQLIIEKTITYLRRKKIRDLWDIFFLLKHVRDFNIIKNNLAELIKKYEPPIDEGDLKIIIIEGIIPTAKEMIDYIQRKWENPNI